MKIYFLGAISGRDKYDDNYRRLVKQLRRMHHEVKSDHILERIPGHSETYPEPDDRKYFESVKRSITESDMLFAEVSHFTPNIGYEISYALENEIPVIAYCAIENEIKVSPLLAGNTHPLFTFRRYKNEELEAKIKEDMIYMTSLANKQFTFIISPSIKSYIDWNFKTRRISRGLFIRLLIEKRMEEDKEYDDAIKKSNTTSTAHE